MQNKGGFTLVEILVTILIVAVLATVAIPGFTKAKTKAEKAQAAAYLRTIRTGMRMYYGKWENYINLPTTADIKSVVGADVQSSKYTFGVSALTPSTFIATAERTSDGKKLTIDQDGTLIDGTI